MNADMLNGVKKLTFILLSPLLLLFCLLLGYMFIVQNILFSPFPFQVPATTKTRLGSHADAINEMFLGNKDAVTSLFEKAGWLIPDTTNKQTTKEIIATSIHNKPYPKAPVSPLYLFKRKEDLVFELSTNTVRDRHHIRLWKTTETYQGQQVWFASDTYDSGIELALKGGFPTHHVRWNIDQERSFTTTSLQKTALIKNILLERITLPIILGFNGNGDWYFHDGNIAVFSIK